MAVVRTVAYKIVNIVTRIATWEKSGKQPSYYKHDDKAVYREKLLVKWLG